MSDQLSSILDELRKPFHPSQVTWKPGAVKGERALAMAYADLRAYMNRLDEVCGELWSVEYEPWGNDRIICRLTIAGVSRSSTGESGKESERSEIGGTSAEAQSFKRAAAMFGLGRYLYNLPTGWADYDPSAKKFTDKAKARLTGILVQQYRRASDGKVDAQNVPAGASDEVDGDAGNDVDAGANTHLDPVIDLLTADVPPAIRVSAAQLARIAELGKKDHGIWASGHETQWAMWASGQKIAKLADLSPEQGDAIIETLARRIAKKEQAA